MTQGILYESITIKLDGSGNGTAKLGPLTVREVWNPNSASVKTVQTTVTNEAVCAIYVGLSASQENFRDQTFTGSSGDVTDLVTGVLKKGNYIWAVWTGGDANVQATLVVSGSKDI
jgi:hypothetical protein